MLDLVRMGCEIEVDRNFTRCRLNSQQSVIQEGNEGKNASVPDRDVLDGSNFSIFLGADMEKLPVHMDHSKIGDHKSVCPINESSVEKNKNKKEGDNGKAQKKSCT